jgi:hypothetical protein
MNLINKNPGLLNEYQNLLNIQEAIWPFNNVDGNIQYNLDNISEEIENYWNQYHDIFNNQIGNIDANPIEKHPYNNQFENSEENDFIVLGTMPPFSYVTESSTLPIFPSILCQTQVGINRIEEIYRKNYNQIRPNILYYYGNVGSFWDYVPNYNQPFNLYSCIDWQENFKTNISDIISFCQRADLTSPSDSNLYNIIPNVDIINNILDSKKIGTILFTSGYPTLDYLNNNKTSTFSIFFKTLNSLGFNYLFQTYGNIIDTDNNIEIVIGKGLFHLILEYNGKTKFITIICLPSPSGQAARVMHHHPFWNNWALQFPNNLPVTPTTEFRRNIYELSFNRDYNALDLLQ